MTLMNEQDEPERRRGKWTIVLLVVTLFGGTAYFLNTRSQQAPEVVNRSVESVPTAPAPPVVKTEPELTPEKKPVRTVPKPEPEPEPEPEFDVLPTPPPPVPNPTLLRVTSDVGEAIVFIDRKYAGTTPFETSDISPGPHRINVSASGYEGRAEDVEIGEDLVELSVRFLEVRLNEWISVVHKHRFGNCEGRLVATLDGIHYETDHDDAFSVSLADLDEFSVDYLKHNLRIQKQGGRTYNFTDDKGNADALLIFHRAVKKVREQLTRSHRPTNS